MCGIAGLWAPGRGDRASRLAEVGAMAGVLGHRGPDGAGTWEDPERGVALGHRRLAIVGLGPSGAQPMTSRSGRWVVTYNGEVYNAPELGRRLEDAGHVFRGTSDTEVLVEALDAHGLEGALDLLDGMFAFGAWDREEQRLVLARDRMGEKPLAYGPVPGGIAFASELTALRTLDGFDRSISPEAVLLLLRYKYVPAPHTIHPGASKVPAGCWVEVTDGGRRVSPPNAYWSLAALAEEPPPPRRPDDELLDELDATLARAVGRQLRSDVDLGAFLSGGIDSSIVATIAAEQLDRPLRTFTIGSPDRDHDEASHARTVAERIGAEHTELVVTAEEAQAEVPEVAARWDEPFADSSQVPTSIVARLARGAVTVALSGDGGDELFGGYNRHTWLPAAWERARRAPAPSRRLGATVLGGPSPATWDRLARLLPEARRPRLLGLKVAKMASVLGAPDEAAAYGRLVSHWQDPGALVPGVAEPLTLAHDRSRWPAAGSFAEQLMAVDALTYLPDDVLVKVDRATMHVSLEARVPLLARPVVELAANLPLDLKIRDGQGKWALRRLLDRRHPPGLFDRSKSGFGIPIALWLRGPLRPWAEDLLAPDHLARLPMLDPTPVRAAWAEHQSGRRDRSYELWDVLMLAGWLDAHAHADADALAAAGQR